MRGTGLSHLTRVRIGTIKKYFQYLQEALPAKLCQIHVLNVVPFFDKIMAMIKPFMRAEIFKVVSHIHFSLNGLLDYLIKCFVIHFRCTPTHQE